MFVKGKVSVIICAAGKGERAGFGKNKLLAPIYGAPALYHTLKKFAVKEIDEIIVTVSPNDEKEISAVCSPFACTIVRGGETRTQSVKNALEKITGEIVLIHDGARPFLSRHLILNCIDSVKRFGSAVCAVKITDTAVCGRLGEITDRLDRDTTFCVQTPQGFYTEDIARAYELSNGKEYTDDSAVFGEFIAPPRLIDGERQNIKLTYKEDFNREINTLISGKDARVGFGADVHAFCEGSEVTLGGVKIPFCRSLAAHSDGDVVIHAVMDALLSAAGLKDIGHYFPDTDEKYKGADSKQLLKKVVEIITKQGFKAENVSVTVQAEKPKLAPYINNMKEKISGILGTDASATAISAGTCEGLGFVGEQLGICAYAAVTLKKADE